MSWLCAVRRGSERPRCWTTLPSAPRGFGSCERSGLSRRWSSHTPASTNSVRHCSTASRVFLRRSGMHCPRPLASAPVSRRTGSWSGSRCSAWCPRWPRDSRCSRSSMTHSGSTESPRRRLGLWPGGCWPSGRCWHSACGDPSGEQELAGLPELVVTGLGDGDARALLDSVISGPVDQRVRDRIVAETRGNPLALLELPRGLSPTEFAFGYRLTDTMPLASRIEGGVPAPARAASGRDEAGAVTAAAEPGGDDALLWRAVGRLGIGHEAAAAAEATGLIELGPRVRFRRPLVRSAAYRSASLLDRQDIHQALAEVTDPDLDPDRRAWTGRTPPSVPTRASPASWSVR